MKFSTVLCTMAVVGLFSGCQIAMNRRISAYMETWRGLSEQDQMRLRQGEVQSGDTEDMVRISLGQPDKVLPITGRDGENRTIWLYHTKEFVSGYDPLDPDSIYHQEMRSIEQTVIFHDGVVSFPVGTVGDSVAKPVESQARRTAEIIHDGVVSFPARIVGDSVAKPVESRATLIAEFMEARLDRLVALTSEQRVNARYIFEEANGELLALSPDERPAKGIPIRVRMRADIRAILTLEQQANYDAAPQYLGGGSTKRQPRQVDSRLPAN